MEPDVIAPHLILILRSHGISSLQSFLWPLGVFALDPAVTFCRLEAQMFICRENTQSQHCESPQHGLNVCPLALRLLSPCRLALSNCNFRHLLRIISLSCRIQISCVNGGQQRKYSTWNVHKSRELIEGTSNIECLLILHFVILSSQTANT